MKEMVYLNVREPNKDILYEGDYLGFHFIIVSYGIHPCAYVEIPKDHKWFGKDYDEEGLENIVCHGGLTYADNLDHVLGKEQAKGRWFIGWDYAHTGDYEGYYLDSRFDYSLFQKDKKWTTAEIYEEVKNVIKQIKKDAD